MHRSKEEQMLFKHFGDMIQMSYQRGIPVFSDFIGLHETELVYQALSERYPSLSEVSYPMAVYGGYPEAERKIVCFLPDSFYPAPEPEDYPLDCIRIAPVNRRFSDPLTHRDFLGTVMGLGLERDQIGDIIVKQEGSEGNKMPAGYLFCKNNKSELLLDITRIRHTTVTAEVVDAGDLDQIQEYKDITGNVSSLRLDAILAVAVRTSRSQGLQLIRDGNIYINGKCCTENARQLSDGDILSVRGYGKYRFLHNGSRSKKGRYQITVKQYI